MHLRWSTTGYYFLLKNQTVIASIVKHQIFNCCISSRDFKAIFQSLLGPENVNPVSCIYFNQVQIQIGQLMSEALNELHCKLHGLDTRWMNCQ